MSSTQSTAPLRSLLQPGAAVIAPGAANALTARIIEDLGFEMLYVTGAGRHRPCDAD